MQVTFWVLPWSKGQTITRIHGERDEYCPYCKQITKITIKSIELRHILGRSFDGVDFIPICNRCKKEGKYDDKDKDILIKEFLQMEPQYKQEETISEGFSKYEKGKYDEAIKLFDEALAYSQNDTATYGKASCLISLGKFSEASELARYLESKYPQDTDVLDMVDVLHKHGIRW